MRCLCEGAKGEDHLYQVRFTCYGRLGASDPGSDSVEYADREWRERLSPRGVRCGGPKVAAA